MHTTPVSLLERLRQPGDQGAWARFVELYTPLLYYWARHAGLQTSDAEDLVQDVFTLLVQKMPEFAYDRHKSFRGWLRKVALNKWREKQRRALGPQLMDGEALATLPSAASIEDLWELDYRQHVVRRAIELMHNEFQPTTWKACWEFVASDRPAAAVALELGISVGAVRAAKFRVLCRLRQELDGLID